MDNPEVSVIIPVYNYADGIERCVKSIMEQSYRSFEIILVDDGSTDGSSEKCDELAERYEEVKAIHQENLGQSAARGSGVDNASGRWISFVDQDDALPPSALAWLMAPADDDTDIILGNGYSIGRDGEIGMEEFRHLAVRGEGTIGVPWGSLYRKNALHGSFFVVPREVINGEDYIFWLRLVFSTDKPVRVVYAKTYDKGPDNTSGSFVWTSGYCNTIHRLRMDAIPDGQHQIFMHDTIKDRIANLFDTSLYESRRVWKKSEFYRDLAADMEREDVAFTTKQKLFLNIPSRGLRRFCSFVMKNIKKHS